MKPLNLFNSLSGGALNRVILLTLVVTLHGCTYITRHYAEPCKSRAYIGNNLTEYLSKRFNSGAPVRVGIIPYSTPANLAPGKGAETPSFGFQIAWKLQQELIAVGEIPILEVFNREDWPGKKDEFFTGNFGALSFARQAGYDIIIVGYLEPQVSLESMTANTKVIEVDSGITVYHSKTSVSTNRKDYESTLSSLWLSERNPSRMYMPEMTEALTRCIVRGIHRADE